MAMKQTEKNLEMFFEPHFGLTVLVLEAVKVVSLCADLISASMKFRGILNIKYQTVFPKQVIFFRLCCE